MTGQTCTWAAVAALGIAVAAPAQAERVRVTDEEFRATHVGKCINYSGPSKGRQCFAADGTTSYDDLTYGKDTGTYTFKDGQLCVSYVQEPELDCGGLSRNGKVYSDGEYRWTIE